VAHPLWPLFDLRVRSERLELRYPTDDDLVELVAVAKAGIHPPDEMPFAVPWTDLPSPAFERSFVQYHWTTRAEWKPDHWILNLAAVLDGRPIGTQGMEATNFAVLRTVSTGSWLGRQWQGQGIGKEMRSAILALAFDGLGAEVAVSGAFLDNPSSSGVSRALGYVENGIERLAPRGEAKDLTRYRLTREVWRGRPRPAVEIDGLDACLELFGAVPAPGAEPAAR
jgi:RimJ/RimL family protein N-acetyltransferase